VGEVALVSLLKEPYECVPLRGPDRGVDIPK